MSKSYSSRQQMAAKINIHQAQALIVMLRDYKDITSMHDMHSRFVPETEIIFW